MTAKGARDVFIRTRDLRRHYAASRQAVRAAVVSDTLVITAVAPHDGAYRFGPPPS